MDENTHVCLFSGIGGFSLAAESCGLRTVVSLTLAKNVTASANEKGERPERAGGDVEMQNRAESARSGSVQRPG
jgi:site-specific DNA-cytosine methylase